CFTFMALVALLAIALQMAKGQGPVELSGYLIVYSVILVPGVTFIAGASVLLNVLLRDKYLAYAVIIATGGGLFYLYSQGYNHWSYNPLLYQLWTYADVTRGGSAQTRILAHRMYCLALASLCLSLAHLFLRRKSTIGFRTGEYPSSGKWSILTALIAIAVIV